MNPSRLRTGDLARAAGVNVQTLRYYERRGLLESPERTPGGHRLYPPRTVEVLQVIKAAQRLGFTLNEVAEVLDQHRRGRRGGLHARALLKLAEVEAQMAQLAEIRDALRRAVTGGCDDVPQCTAERSCPLSDEGHGRPGAGGDGRAARASSPSRGQP